MFFILYQIQTVCDDDSRQQDDIEILAFMVVLFLTPSTVIEKQVLLINNLLRISSKHYQDCQANISWHWSVLLALAFKLAYFEKTIEFLNEATFLEFMFILPKFLITWLIFLFSHLTSFAISLLVGYTEWIRNRISSVEEKLLQAIQQKRLRSVKNMRRKMASLLVLNQWCSRITEEAFDCLSAQMALLAYFTLNFLPAQSILDLDFKLINVLSIYSLKCLIFS